MSTELTPLCTRFVEAMNAQDSAAFIACFDPAAVVQDEGQTHRGIAAIKAWIENAFIKYQPQLQVTEVTNGDPETIITGSVSGTFDGSPIILHYHLTIQDEKIVALNCRV